MLYKDLKYEQLETITNQFNMARKLKRSGGKLQKFRRILPSSYLEVSCSLLNTLGIMEGALWMHYIQERCCEVSLSGLNVRRNLALYQKLDDLMYGF